MVGVTRQRPSCCPSAGRVTRVNGPLIEATGLRAVAMFDVVDVGESRLPGEVVGIRDDVATIQAYEYTGGLAPGAPARSRGKPLSAPLGPHLLGGVFDGLLRPLSRAGVWLDPAAARSGPGGRRFMFTPSVTAGTMLRPGAMVGTVAVSGPVQYQRARPAGDRAAGSTRCGPLARAGQAGSSRPWAARGSGSPRRGLFGFRARRVSASMRPRLCSPASG